MTLEDYMRNLRGVNDGKDFPKEHLVCILWTNAHKSDVSLILYLDRVLSMRLSGMMKL